MKNFLSYINGFKWFTLIFLSLIAVVTIPGKMYEHQYGEVVLILAIIAYIITILVILIYFFSSMAVSFTSDDKVICFTYGNEKTVEIPHTQIFLIKCTTYRYIFYIENGRKIFLSRMTGLFSYEKTVNKELAELYPGRIKAGW